jgi:hypothetical protein
MAQVLLDMAGGTQFAKSEDIGSISHPSKVIPTGAVNRGKFQIPPQAWAGTLW